MSNDLSPSATEVLQPYQKVPRPQTGTLLIVGAEGTPKKQFAESLADVNVPFLLQIRLANYLPLPKDNEDKRPNIDFIVFMLEMNNSRSITSVNDSLKYLDATYFLGRVCFVVLQASNESIHCTDITDITNLCDSFDSPMFAGNFEEEEERSIIARQVLQMMEISAGFKPQVSSLMVQAAGQSYRYLPEDNT